MPVPQKFLCHVNHITNHGSQVYTLELQPDRPVPHFLPGQFLHLAIDPYTPGDFWPESRVFSIASSPDQRTLLQITYSVRGSFTARMENEVKLGSTIWIKMPYGEFVIAPQNDIVLFAGGTGITAFTAFLENLDSTFFKPINVFYGARTRDLLIYRYMLEACHQKIPHFNRLYFIENGSTASAEMERPGIIHLKTAMPEIPNPLSATFYLSGPPAMLSSISSDLIAYGISRQAIKVDAW